MVDMLVSFGADPSALRLLDDDSPDLLPYATVTTARRNADATLGVVEAVYEWQGAPLVFLVNADSLQGHVHIQRIRRLLAMRGDAPYVAVVAPGRLDVYRVALDRKSLRQARVDWDDSMRSAIFPRLASVRPKGVITNRGWIFNVILSLLTDSMTALIELNVPHDDAISLVGRALFTRFLADRDLLPAHMSDAANTASLFATRDNATRTSEWLDTTFNGDMLPLSADIYEILPDHGCRVLQDILRRASDGQLLIEWEEKWANLHFAHIPAGVLSQAYEHYLRNHASSKQKKEGGYFTPRPIVDLMVRASFRALQRHGTEKSAKILDPAVGGGIFLLTAFRELVAAHWRSNGARPDTIDLRRILYNQLVGFDINEAALRFASLGLYLMLIELDVNPRPLDKLKFDDLRGRVLHRVKDEDEELGKDLGSLGPFVGNDHVGQYDIVIGNPPWASGTMLSNWDFVRTTVARIAEHREIANQVPPLPNEGLDLPFVWRAMEWAKPHSQIAFAVHARLLFQQGDGMPKAREALFEALDVTSIINGAELRKTKVWPQVTAPFCILFATNRTPRVGAGFRFISPRIDLGLNNCGSMRIDAGNADIVSTHRLRATPDLLKILFRGTSADLRIVERIRAQGHPTLADFWRKRIGAGAGMRLRGSGNGYQTLRASSRVRRRGGDGLPGADASYLHRLREITTADSLGNLFVVPGSLDLFSHDRIHDPRAPELFNGPLVVVHKSVRADRGRIGVWISNESVVFNETFYGYSTSGQPNARQLACYLALVLGSKLTLWLALVTSGEFGVEREVIEKATLDRIPLPDFDKLSENHHQEMAGLAEGLQSGLLSWEHVDDWVMRLYGFADRDLQVISDTLEFGSPFAENESEAQQAPTRTEKQRFCEVLQEELNPWCERFGSTLAVGPSSSLAMSHWESIAVWNGLREAAERVPTSDWQGLMMTADREAATEVVFHTEQGGLLVARLAQRRYWSETQARLLAQRIIWSHVDLLKGHVDA